MKDCTTCKYGFVDEQLGFPMCHHPLRFSEDCVDFNMHEDIEEPEKATGIEEKKLPEGLEEAAEEYTRSEYSSPCAFGGENIEEWVSRIFIAGAEWDRTKMMEKAVKGEVVGYDDGTGMFITVLEDLPDDSPYKVHDKVKLIVIPEEK